MLDASDVKGPIAVTRQRVTIGCAPDCGVSKVAAGHGIRDACALRWTAEAQPLWLRAVGAGSVG
jgi:hypothetical protein